MHRKNRFRLASSKRRTLNTGWYGIGSPHRASSPNTADRAATRMVSSKVTGMKAGQLFKGRPPTFRVVHGHRPVLQEEPSEAPEKAPDEDDERQPGLVKPSASARPSTGRGVGVHAPVPSA
jgi:hypothetical protein